MDLVNCITSFSFVDQIVTSSIGLLIQGPWFSYAHIEVGGGDIMLSCIREFRSGVLPLPIDLPAYWNDVVIMQITSLISFKGGRVKRRRNI